MEHIKSHLSSKRVFVVIIFFVLFWFALGLISTSDFPKVSSDKWQAVFLENNQVYFGKLSNENQKYVTLTNVYYLRVADSLVTDKSAQNINLVKLGGEFHGPEDKMFISKDKILFWENLTDSSSVVKTILSNK